jgi:hypothetical protein
MSAGFGKSIQWPIKTLRAYQDGAGVPVQQAMGEDHIAIKFA